MKQLTPALFLCLKDYSKDKFVKDIISGIIVAIIALPLSIALALASGVSRLTESVYETRFFGYCTELTDMGANIKIEGKTAIVTGRPKLKGNVVCARDLRAGAALVIAGLCAEGTTYVENIHFIERGYERMVEKFRDLGADISRAE